ncbi:MAG: DNA repair protein RadA [Deltaproteobacteria bacterium]|jgi:DNA repair protein RadA/Sms|nr:DNA repair protein RadA [Deltaproteobacteria bacterium]
MAKPREIYICSDCGHQSAQWKGQCGGCGAWNSLEATMPRPAAKAGFSGLPGAPGGPQSLSRLSEAPDIIADSFSTGIQALDRVLGSGLVPGAAILIGGEPGIGKSTLLLQLAGAVAASGRKTIYLSGEESLGQIKARAERLGVLHENLLALASNQIDDILPIIESAGKAHAKNDAPKLLIADSVQTLCSSRADGLPGNVSQVRAVAAELMEACKRNGVTLIIVGHVTKEGNLAGPKLLEHMVDTVISLEGDREQVFRIMRVLKNRFGPNQELLIFQMLGQGLDLIEDPSTYFLGARDPKLSGAAVVMAVDGQRTFAVEVQALASRSYLSIPRRAALGLDVNRLHLILAVLEKRLKLNFAQTDIYVKIGGGMRLQEPGLDLALVASILSSFYDLALPERGAFWGEVDLNGQIRPVASHALRKDQALRLGYAPLFYPRVEGEPGGIRGLNELLEALFANKNKQNT